MAGFLWLPLLVAVVVAVASLVPALAPWNRFAGVAVSSVVLLSGAALVGATLAERVPTGAGGSLRADALSAYMLTVVGAVGLTATWGGLQRQRGGHDAVYAALVSAFLGAMSLAVLADNLGLLWVAVEATTIATAFLVGHHRTRTALEAAWKYVVLGSVGIAIAFLGIVLLYAASRAAGSPTLSWVALQQGGVGMDPMLVEVAVALAILGFATKAGLAPMHSWLPDAHSQAPAPVSGLMSGVLLSVAFYAILRMQSLADAIVGGELIRWMLAVGGLLSLAVPALLLIRQRDYKRMLAYSSVEHMGLMALGAAAGGVLGLSAVLLHMLGHGLAKSTMFVLTGRMLAVEGSSLVAEVRGLLARRPGLGGPFLVGMAALLGFPPFSIFFSEVGIFVALWQQGLGWVAAVGLALLLVVFAGLTRLTAAMLLGAPPEPVRHVDRSWHGPSLPLLIALGVTAVVAFLAGPLSDVLVRSAELLVGGA